MSIYEQSNGIASTIDLKCNRKKQDKRLSNHHFTLHLPEKTKHPSSDPRYAAIKWYSINFQLVFEMQIIGVLVKHWRATSVGAHFQCSPGADHDFLLDSPLMGFHVAVCLASSN